MGEPLEVRPLLRATRHEDLAPETKALKELKPSFTRQVGGKGIVVFGISANLYEILIDFDTISSIASTAAEAVLVLLSLVVVVVDLQIENQIEQVPTPQKNPGKHQKPHVHGAPPCGLLAFYTVPKVPRQEHSRITGASFSPVAPHRLAVVSGTKVGPDPAVGLFHSPDGNVDIPYVLLVNTGNMPLFFWGSYWA